MPRRDLTFWLARGPVLQPVAGSAVGSGAFVADKVVVTWWGIARGRVTVSGRMVSGSGFGPGRDRRSMTWRLVGGPDWAAGLPDWLAGLIAEAELEARTATAVGRGEA